MNLLACCDGGTWKTGLRPPGTRAKVNPRRRRQAPTDPPVYGRACPGRGLPQPESAITTRPNHPLPRQDFHLRACQRLKAAHRNLLFQGERRVAAPGTSGQQTILEASIEAAIAKEALKREAHWTESLAVGRRGYAERIQPLILSRRETGLIEEPCGWVLKEDGVPYHAKRAKEIASKALPWHGILPRCCKIKCLLRRHRNLGTLLIR